jgi:hypothetical protein
MERQISGWLIPLLLAVGAGAALWYYWVQTNEPAAEPVLLPRPVVEPPSPVPEPVYPLPEAAPRAARPELTPLPPLAQSDDYFKLALADILGASIETMLARSGVIERIVATVDNLPRSQVAERIRPLDRLGGQFVVDGQDDSGEYYINSSNFERYDGLVDLLTGADVAELAEVYRRFYPLFQKSYVDLGYPDGYFNDRLVEVIDHLLATPDIADSVMLVRPHVLYEFADPDLQNRSSGQKLLLRIGSEHRKRIKQTLREFREIATRL